MIVYRADKAEFHRHALRDDIVDVITSSFRDALGYSPAGGEMRAWRSSLLEMAMVLQDDEIPSDTGVAIEYQLPRTAKRIDFMITGEDETGRPRVVIVELKQWSSSHRSEKDGIVWAHRGGPGGEREGLHPSYQAWSYAAYLQDFNEAVQEGSIGLQPCAYLHNHRRDGEIDHPHYREYLERAPLFLAHERRKLQAFIREHVRYGDRRGTLFAIESGRIRPSKSLIDSVAGMLQGKPEFVLLDDQKLVFESALAAEARAGLRKQVVLVRGGPGTGKSVVAIRLLASLLARERNVRYVSKNRAPRQVIEARLTGTFRATRIRNLFSGSGSFTDCEADLFDALVVDEAHRLNEKSGRYRNQGDHQVRELIRAARCTVFFIDDDQRVTVYDVGESELLGRFAAEAGAEVTELELASQFRCNGSEGYLAWLEDVLGIRPTANQFLDTREFDFRVIDDPSELHSLIETKNRTNNRSRVVAGYCWPWPSRNDASAWDIELPAHGYRRRWNLDRDGGLWIVTPGSVEQVGCIHTCQGLELEYVGVIIGPDLLARDGKVVADARQRARSDQSVRGLAGLMRTDAAAARELGDRIVRNTYRTLMTRGMKGCFVHCTDTALAQLLRSRLRESRPEASVVVLPIRPSVPLRAATPEDRQAGVASVPRVELRIAAGSFSDVQALESGAEDWWLLPDWIRPQPGLFIAQVVGESMNRRIPNGAWCLFRANPGGSRQGKVVVVQHRDIADPETGGRFTVKIYRSEKVPDEDGGWRHERVVLSPDSDFPGYDPIVLERRQDDEFAVVAELLKVLEAGDG